MDGTFVTAILLTTIAGLSTTLGSLVAILYTNPSHRFMAFTLGFSAGVMVFVSFVELLKTGIESTGFEIAVVSFFCGMALMFLVDYLLPHTYILEPVQGGNRARLKRLSLLIALGVGIHNLPEGMVTFVGTLKDADLGVALMFAIAVHNIPEGMAVAVPVYAATGSRFRAFGWSFLSGVSEPIGALMAGLFLYKFMSDILLGMMLSLVAGFMVFISLDELLPSSYSYRCEHVAIAGVMAGMAVMAFSLYFFL